MPNLPYVRNFRELMVYAKALDLASDVFGISKTFPREEMYALTDQIRRSSRSIGAQIAEAWAKRRYPKHFASKLTDADGEQNETQHWVEVAYQSKYIDHSQRDHLINLCSEIGRMLGSMINQPEGFSGDKSGSVREDAVPFLANSTPRNGD